MKRLLEQGLIYGNLYHVSSPSMVKRYNRALEHLIGKRTALEDFHIDIAGYSPEIAEEFDDPLYLNPQGCNHLFILLSFVQQSAPLLDSHFSTTRAILQQFIRQNEERLFALLAQDALAGEVDNTVFQIDSLVDILKTRHVSLRADTTAGHIDKARELDALIKRFQTEEDAWWDQKLIDNMIQIGRETGNVALQPIILEHTEFDQKDFYCSYFGGVYVYQSLALPVVVGDPKCCDDKARETIFLVNKNDPAELGYFLEDHDLVEIAIRKDNPVSIRNFELKMDMLIARALTAEGEDVSRMTPSQMRVRARKYSSDLGEAFAGLSDVLRWANGQAAWPDVGPGHPAFFYILRSTTHESSDVTNMLLSELTPLDLRTLYITHKAKFYEAYNDQNDLMKEYVVNALRRDYLENKAGFRSSLFGADEPSARRVGPWG